MRIGVTYTKRTPRIIKILDKFAIGIQAIGDQFIKLQSILALKEWTHRCDVFIMFGWFSESHLDNSETSAKLLFRKYILEQCRLYRKRFLVIDTCFFNDHINWHAIGFDGIKGEAKFYNTNSLPDRWQAHNIEIKPWQKNGEHILVLGQNRLNVSVPDINFWDWHLDICKKIHEISDRPIVFRPHPREKIKQSLTLLPGWVKVSQNKTLQEDLESCWTAISCSSNALVQALIEGVPAICLSPNHVLSNRVGNSLEQIDSPMYSKREQILYDLAYAQWHISEIHSGQAWQHLRQFVYA